MLFAKRLERKVDASTAQLVRVENKLSQISEENDRLIGQNASFVYHITELEKRCAALVEAKTALEKENHVLKGEREKAFAELEALKDELTALKEKAGAVPAAPSESKKDTKSSSELVDTWKNGEGVDAWR